VIVADAVLGTTPVVIVKLTEVEPAGAVTVEGTAAFALLEVKLTTAPPGPAAPLSVTEPTATVPPTTEAGATVSPVSVAGVIVRLAVCVAPPWTPVIVTDVSLVTDVVDTSKVAVVEPSATVTVEGSVANELLDVRLTTSPPAGAATLSVAVPVELPPPVTTPGNSVKEASDAPATFSV